MSATRLTDTAIKAAKPRPQRYEMWDEQVPGLALRVSPAGKKTWTVRYRPHTGRQRRMTLGHYPQKGVAEARREALQALAAVSSGEDPAQNRKAAKHEATVTRARTVAALFEAYQQEGARRKSPAWLKEEARLFRTRILPRFGGTPVAELRRADIQDFIEKVTADAPVVGDKCRTVLRAALNYAVDREWIEANPAARIKALIKPSSRARVLADTEVICFWTKLDEAPAAPSTRIALRLLLVTLQRRSEVAGMHADEIDRDARLWTLPGERTKNGRTHVVPLSNLALSLIDAAFQLANPDGAWRGFAFPNRRHNDTPVTGKSLTRALARSLSVLGLQNVTPHDLRRTGSTAITSEKIGMPADIVSRTLNHASATGGVTAIYDRNSYLEKKRRALDAWAAEIESLASGEEPTRNVIRASCV